MEITNKQKGELLDKAVLENPNKDCFIIKEYLFIGDKKYLLTDLLCKK